MVGYAVIGNENEVKGLMQVSSIEDKLWDARLHWHIQWRPESNSSGMALAMVVDGI